MVEVVRKIEQVIADRATSPDHADIPGGSSGLVVLKSIRKDGTKISAVDTRMVAELLGTYEHIAREPDQQKSTVAGDPVYKRMGPIYRRMADQKKVLLNPDSDL